MPRPIEPDTLAHLAVRASAKSLHDILLKLEENWRPKPLVPERNKSPK